ncbi:MAG: bifunctional oligoribonuclease/PAP phosphatase NrnA [Bacteroidales bacterium]|nr:bifunctional oligoribonuclease/PAP phosphatase NrnA [Bacteroidales bacterium]
MKEEFVQKFRELTESARRPAVITHFDPDGDAVGSALGMALYLQKKVKNKVPVLIPNTDPAFLQWLPGHDQVVFYDRDPEACARVIQASDLLILVDFNVRNRLKKMEPCVFASRIPSVLIDHHPDPDLPAILVISDTERSSTAELIYDLIMRCGDAELIDTDIAVNLFTGIMTDTGCFSYNASRPRTFEITAQLLQYPFNKDTVYRNVYDFYSEQRMRLMGYCLHQKMKVIPGCRTAYIALTRKELEDFHHEPGDTEGFVNLPFSIRGTLVTALFTEKDDHVKISFRSRGSFAVNTFASRYFSGGGHFHAAGGEYPLPLDAAVQKFTEMIQQHKDEIRD